MERRLRRQLGRPDGAARARVATRKPLVVRESAEKDSARVGRLTDGETCSIQEIARTYSGSVRARVSWTVPAQDPHAYHR
eukprot:COSAG02_NODE_6011_length_3877_cov_4.773690_3_plen_79_part_01